jgi:hypothetical protein
MTRARVWRALVGVVVLAATTAACGTPLPAPSPEPPPAVAPPVLSVTQSTSVLDDIGRALAAGDEALDPAALAPRVIGPALTMRAAEYKRAQATNGERPPTALPTDAQVEIVPQSTTWPRVELVVTEQPDDLQAPRVLVLLQQTPRDRYALWGWARMFPGVSTPQTADADVGSPVLDPDDADLAMSPDDVLAAYGDLLAQGDASQYAASFVDDPFRQSIVSARQALTANVQEIGAVAETYTPQGTPLTVIGTADDEAIVVGTVETVSTVTITVAGAKLNLSAYEAALSGVTEATTSLVRTYTDVLVFRVPPAGSGEQVQLIAAEAVLTSVTAQ